MSNITDMSEHGHVIQPLSVKARLIIDEVEVELRHAIADYEPNNSYHEGYAVILEELDELWSEIKMKPLYRNQEKLRREAIQVAAMAIRFILDTLPEQVG